MVTVADDVRHDTIVLPQDVGPTQVVQLAQKKAESQVGENDWVTALHLVGAVQHGGPQSNEREWSYRFTDHPAPADQRLTPTLDVQ